MLFISPSYSVFAFYLFLDTSRKNHLILEIDFGFMMLIQTLLAFAIDKGQRSRYLEIHRAKNDRNSVKEILNTITPGIVILSQN